MQDKSSKVDIFHQASARISPSLDVAETLVIVIMYKSLSDIVSLQITYLHESLRARMAGFQQTPVVPQTKHRPTKPQTRAWVLRLVRYCLIMR